MQKTYKFENYLFIVFQEETALLMLNLVKQHHWAGKNLIACMKIFFFSPLSWVLNNSKASLMYLQIS